MHRQTSTLNTLLHAAPRLLSIKYSHHQSMGHCQGLAEPAVVMEPRITVMPPYLLERRGWSCKKCDFVGDFSHTVLSISSTSEFKSEYKRVSTNTSMLCKNDYSSSSSSTSCSDITSTLQHRQSFGSMTSSNFGYLTPTSRRRW